MARSPIVSLEIFAKYEEAKTLVEAGMSQTGAAARVGIDRGNLSVWLAAGAPPPPVAPGGGWAFGRGLVMHGGPQVPVVDD